MIFLLHEQIYIYVFYIISLSLENVLRAWLLSNG